MSAHSSNRIWWYRSTLPLVWCRSGRVYFTVVPVSAHALCRVRIGSRSRCRRDHPLTGDPDRLESCDGSMPEPDCGDGLFLVQDSGVREAVPVIERRVHEPEAATSGDTALVVVAVAAALGSRSPRSRRARPAWRRMCCTIDRARPSSCTMCSATERRFLRNRITSWRTRRGVRFGERRGRDDRSNSPRSPSARNRSRHFRTGLGSSWNRSAVASMVQPSRGRGEPSVGDLGVCCRAW